MSNNSKIEAVGDLANNFLTSVITKIFKKVFYAGAVSGVLFLSIGYFLGASYG